MKTQLPNPLNDLFLHQGYLLNRDAVCLSDLAPVPELPSLAGFHLNEPFCKDSAYKLQKQIRSCLTPSSQRPIEEQFYLYLTPEFEPKYRYRNKVHSCMVPIRTDSDPETLVLWQPIVMHRQLTWGTYSVSIFEQWLSLMLDLLWRYQQPFSLLMFDVTNNRNTRPPVYRLVDWLPELIAKLPPSAITAQLGHFRWGAILPHCEAQTCESYIQEIKDLFATVAPVLPELRLSIASQSFNFWPDAEPPGGDSINQQLLAGLQVELEQQNLSFKSSV